MKTLCLAILIILIPSSISSGLGYWHDVPDPSKPAVMGPLVGDNLSGKWRLRR